MMSSISWKEYFTFLSIVLICYYLFIVIVYYRHELLQFRSLLPRPTSRGTANNAMTIAVQASSWPANEPVPHETFKPDSEPDEHTLLNELLEKLKQQIADAGKKKLIKEELLVSIQLLLAEYFNLQYSTFVSPIENYIQSDVENQCSIYLTDQEVSSLWKK